MTGNGKPPASELRRQRQQIPVVRRAASWLGWWILLMGLWVAVDDSIGLAELGAGAGAAALAAFLAETAGHQADTHFRMRARWLLPAFRLPGQVAADTVVVFAALARQLARGQPPDSGFRDQPVRFGDQSAIGVTRRVLLIGAHSLAPNTVVVGLEEDPDVMVVHQLVISQGRAGE